MKDNENAPETEEVKQNKKAEKTSKKEELKEVLKREEELKTQLGELDDKYKRVLAEYDNFRKRSQKEKESFYRDILADNINAFLPVLDNLERGAQSGDDGIKLILKQFNEILEKYGVKSSTDAGDTFDPNLHDAVMHVEDESFEENVVCEVLLKGYTMGDKVIRHAMVKVAN